MAAALSDTLTALFDTLTGQFTIFHFQFPPPGTGRGGISSTKVVLLLYYGREPVNMLMRRAGLPTELSRYYV